MVEATPEATGGIAQEGVVRVKYTGQKPLYSVPYALINHPQLNLVRVLLSEWDTAPNR